MVKEIFDLNLLNKKQETPIELALKNKKYEAIQYLIQNGADPNYKYQNIPNKKPYLHQAITARDIKAIETLLQNKKTNPNITDPTKDDYSILHYIAEAPCKLKGSQTSENDVKDILKKIMNKKYL